MVATAESADPASVPTPDCDGDGDGDTLFDRIQRWMKSPWLIGLMVIGLLYALYSVAPPSEWVDAFSRAEPLWLVAAVLLVLPHEMLKVLRMEQVLPEVKPARIRHSAIVYQMACVAQLPFGTIGGDFYRICRLEECGANAEDATAGTFIIRMIGFASTVTLSGIGAFFVFGWLWPLLGPVLGALILYLLARSQKPPRFVAWLVEHADDVPRNVFGKILSGTARLLRHMFREAAALKRGQMFRVLGYALALYGVRTAILWVCLLALGLDVSFLAALAALAVGNLASSVPSPTGNVGLREGGIVGILSGFSVAAAPATIAALLFRAAIIVGAGLGLGLSLFAVRMFGKPAAAAP